MRNEEQIIARCDLYKKQLVLAVEEKTTSLVVDPSLDILILSLIDKRQYKYMNIMKQDVDSG